MHIRFCVCVCVCVFNLNALHTVACFLLLHHHGGPRPTCSKGPEWLLWSHRNSLSPKLETKDCGTGQCERNQKKHQNFHFWFRFLTLAKLVLTRQPVLAGLPTQYTLCKALHVATGTHKLGRSDKVDTVPTGRDYVFVLLHLKTPGEALLRDLCLLSYYYFSCSMFDCTFNLGIEDEGEGGGSKGSVSS